MSIDHNNSMPRERYLQENFVEKLIAYFNEREKFVTENRESQEYAALKLETFGLGLLVAAEVSGFKINLRPKIQELAEKLDPSFSVSQSMRFKAQFITLNITPDQPV